LEREVLPVQSNTHLDAQAEQELLPEAFALHAEVAAVGGLALPVKVLQAR
jgi:hypothetical protein